MATERRRNYVSPTPADFASDEAIEDYAAHLWQAFTQAEGIHMTTQVTQRYADAVAYAATAHAAQRRKGTDIPYIAHLLAVSGSVVEAGGGEDQAIAGLLHDVVEDQGGLPRPEGACATRDRGFEANAPVGPLGEKCNGEHEDELAAKPPNGIGWRLSAQLRFSRRGSARRPIGWE